MAIYGYGTNTGIRAVAAGEHGHGEDEIRYGGRGVLIYWHVERGSVVIHSQRLNCSASEVHAMVDGAIRHGTDMHVEANYVDSHGQSEVGFGITKLLCFDLLPRIKRINTVKLYRPATGEPDAWPELAPALTRPIRWDRIEQQYDQMIKYATRSSAPGDTTLADTPRTLSFGCLLQAVRNGAGGAGRRLRQLQKPVLLAGGRFFRCVDLLAESVERRIQESKFLGRDPGTPSTVAEVDRGRIPTEPRGRFRV